MLETELYILEGTSVGGLEQKKLDALAYHGKVIEFKTMLKELKEILKFIRTERFYLFLFWNFAKPLAAGLQPPIKERDFIYKRCVGSLKRLRQLIYSFNYLLTHKQRIQLKQCFSNIRAFMMTSCQMMIDSLAPKPSESDRANQEPKHIILLKTLYGMADEMLSKNFLEEKKTN